MPLEIVGYIASICIGLILGLLGGGGSILSIPILVYLFHMDVVLASAYSLFIVGATSTVGAIPKFKDNHVNVRTALLFGIPMHATTFVTRRWIVHMIPDVIWQYDHFLLSKRVLLLGLFAILMILTSVSMIRGRQEIASDEDRIRTIWLIIQGILIGLLTGLVGAGGGFLIIPALVLLTGLNFKTAVGTSLTIIAINSFAGFAGDLVNFNMDWKMLGGITSLAIIGILIGNQLSHKVESRKLRIAFGFFVLAMGCFILVNELVIHQR
ncbi:MAG TPA: sulfite exporter TauE/SafE family protein [Chryseolinea sp.]|nr:sulfite exporter TauE/SafE family protein [Chryseolinea sp.]